jgi:nucleotide-binding universal stress UspA family protein
VLVATFKNKAVIVVGEDYSQNSTDVREAACGFARTLTEVGIHLVHVARAGDREPFSALSRQPTGAIDPALLDDLQAEKKQLKELTQSTAIAMSTTGTRVFGHLRIGNAAREIVQLASDLSADLIVVGTHGRTGVMHLLLGSVAQSVVTNAPCPVLVVKPGGLPDWPEIEPPCPDCVTVQGSSQGQRLWCERHSQHHESAHTYSTHYEGESYGLGAQSFRGMS